jgi:hypothetical protein
MAAPVTTIRPRIRVTDFKRGLFMNSSFRWFEVRHTQDGVPYDSYFRAKPAAAQFKVLQNKKAKFLQNFCFDPGGCRDRIRNSSE